MIESYRGGNKMNIKEQEPAGFKICILFKKVTLNIDADLKIGVGENKNHFMICYSICVMFVKH